MILTFSKTYVINRTIDTLISEVMTAARSFHTGNKRQSRAWVAPIRIRSPHAESIMGSSSRCHVGPVRHRSGCGAANRLRNLQGPRRLQGEIPCNRVSECRLADVPRDNSILHRLKVETPQGVCRSMPALMRPSETCSPIRSDANG